MNDVKAWWAGFALIVTFVLMSELIIIFRDYVYNRLGLSRDLILIMLWLLPTIASFLVVYLSRNRRVLKGLSLILVLNLLGPLVHFLSGQLGATIDLAGLPGLKITFQIYLVLSTLTIGFGAVMGMFFKKKTVADSTGRPTCTTTPIGITIRLPDGTSKAIRLALKAALILIFTVTPILLAKLIHLDCRLTNVSGSSVVNQDSTSHPAMSLTINTVV